MRTAAGWTALGALAAGATLTGTALALRDADTNAEAVVAMDRVDALNIAAVSCYALSALAGGTWLGLTVWPGGGGVVLSTP